jgi:predicted ArsR family transcriptional regulator
VDCNCSNFFSSASTTAVRRPLAALHEAGLVAASERAPYGPDPGPRRGRPSRVFSLTGAGRAACEQAYDALALEALRFLAERDGRAAVAEFAADRADRLLAGVGSATTAVATVHEVAERLTEQGFAASVEPLARDGAQLCQHHCPVVDAAGEFSELCDAETQALGRLLGRHVTRLATLAQGDGVCTTLIPAQPADTHQSTSPADGEGSNTSQIFDPNMTASATRADTPAARRATTPATHQHRKRVAP